MTKKINEQDWLSEIDKDSTNELQAMQDNVLQKASNILERNVILSSLHGIIGGKNNNYVDCVRTQFWDFEDFFMQWIKGLSDTFEKEKELYLKWHQTINIHDKSSFRIVRLLKEEDIFQYTRKFLERNFYRNIKERTRTKPDESLWEIWFGYELVYGLMIAPEQTTNGWRIDKSEIRRTDYNYWTIGHILHTGFIDAKLNKPYQFTKIEDFYIFYESVLKGLSNSVYEKEIYSKYIEYLKTSDDVLNEPFLIPEFRYAGLKHHHEYRLDFTILNQHTLDFVGFEISPSSSHMSVDKMKDKKQYEVNEELKKKWEKEMSKRNQYFDTFGITVKTFTDTQLQSVDACFEQIKNVLMKRPENKSSVSIEKERLLMLQL
ncbi:hypothetical protein LJC72_05770 [Bacteroides sp. OttesenSCG-928-D19]|nr:hypothetical protein [Bacteroides sp. OttesenSCG-928-N06]MDL2304834.1 hypothetical protein [Bacteroides sp. OttesenSCG-928-D19]